MKERLSKLKIFGLVMVPAIAMSLLGGCVPADMRANDPTEEAVIVNQELADFVDEVYKEPYSLVFNNCIDKSLRIMAKAESLGMKADLIGCVAVLKANCYRGLPIVSPHFYSEIDGRKVDVALDPVREQIYCPNSEVKIIMPLNISEMGRAFSRKCGFSSCPLRGG